MDERYRILKRIETLPSCKIFDGAKLFLPDCLPADQLKSRVPSSSGHEVVAVFIEKPSFDFHHPQAMQIYNVLFNRIM